MAIKIKLNDVACGNLAGGTVNNVMVQMAVTSQHIKNTNRMSDATGHA